MVPLQKLISIHFAFARCAETLQNCVKLAGRTETSIWTNPDERARNETLISVP